MSAPPSGPTGRSKAPYSPYPPNNPPPQGPPQYYPQQQQQWAPPYYNHPGPQAYGPYPPQPGYPQHYIQQPQPPYGAYPNPSGYPQVQPRGAPHPQPPLQPHPHYHQQSPPRPQYGPVPPQYPKQPQQPMNAYYSNTTPPRPMVPPQGGVVYQHQPRPPTTTPGSPPVPPPLGPAPYEKAYYDQLFDHVDRDHKGIIYGKEAVDALSRSGLPKPILRQIWSLADPQAKGTLNREQFYITLRLITMTQAGLVDMSRNPNILVGPELFSHPNLPLPKMDHPIPDAGQGTLTPPRYMSPPPTVLNSPLQQAQQQPAQHHHHHPQQPQQHPPQLPHRLAPQDDEEEEEFTDFDAAPPIATPLSPSDDFGDFASSVPVVEDNEEQPIDLTPPVVTPPIPAPAPSTNHKPPGGSSPMLVPNPLATSPFDDIVLSPVQQTAAPLSSLTSSTLASSPLPTSPLDDSMTALPAPQTEPPGPASEPWKLQSPSKMQSLLDTSILELSGGGANKEDMVPLNLKDHPAHTWALHQATVDVVSRMSAFDCIVDEGEWEDFHEAAPAPGTPPPIPPLASPGDPFASPGRSVAVSPPMPLPGIMQLQSSPPPTITTAAVSLSPPQVLSSSPPAPPQEPVSSPPLTVPFSNLTTVTNHGMDNPFELYEQAMMVVEEEEPVKAPVSAPAPHYAGGAGHIGDEDDDWQEFEAVPAQVTPTQPSAQPSGSFFVPPAVSLGPPSPTLESATTPPPPLRQEEEDEWAEFQGPSTSHGVAAPAPPAPLHHHHDLDPFAFLEHIEPISSSPPPPLVPASTASPIVTPPRSLSPAKHQQDADDDWGDFAASPPPPAPVQTKEESSPFPLHREEISFESPTRGSGSSSRPSSTSYSSPPRMNKSPQRMRSPLRNVVLTEEERERVENAGEEELLEMLKARELLEEAGQCLAHLEAKSRLAQAMVEKERAAVEERFEDAIMIRNRIKELQGLLKTKEDMDSLRRALMTEQRKSTLQDLKSMIAEVDEDRAKAFEQRFLIDQPSLAQQAETDLVGAVRRGRQALRCYLLLDAFASSYLVYPDHWLRVLEVVEEKVRQAITLLQRVDGALAQKPSQVRTEVAASSRVQTFTQAMWEVIRVGRMVLASAQDGLADLVSREHEDFEVLVQEYKACLKAVLGVEGSDGVPSIADIRRAASEEQPGAVLDQRAVCNVSLLPISVAKSVGAPVTYFSGAPFYAPCCNLWLNNISLETPQPESDDPLDW